MTKKNIIASVVLSIMVVCLLILLVLNINKLINTFFEGRFSKPFVNCVRIGMVVIFFFVLVSETSVTDYTPNYGIDATTLVGIFAKNIAIFGALAFLALTVFGVLQTMYIIQAHNRVRRETLATYKSIGMTDDSIKKVLKYEYMTAVFHAVIYLIFILVLAFVGINSFVNVLDILLKNVVSVASTFKLLSSI